MQSVVCTNETSLCVIVSGHNYTVDKITRTNGITVPMTTYYQNCTSFRTVPTILAENTSASDEGLYSIDECMLIQQRDAVSRVNGLEDCDCVRRRSTQYNDEEITPRLTRPQCTHKWNNGARHIATNAVDWEDLSVKEINGARMRNGNLPWRMNTGVLAELQQWGEQKVKR